MTAFSFLFLALLRRALRRRRRHFSSSGSSRGTSTSSPGGSNRRLTALAAIASIVGPRRRLREGAFCGEAEWGGWLDFKSPTPPAPKFTFTSESGGFFSAIRFALLKEAIKLLAEAI